MQRLLQYILKVLAQAIIKKYQPTVVAITGSVGKTSTKNAIFAVVNHIGSVRASLKSYNNEIGIPLTIIGCWAAGKNPFGWLVVFFRGIRLLLRHDPRYPRILILEMAADKPGDLVYLTGIARPSVSIVTAVGEAHLEFFKSVENIVREKRVLVTELASGGLAVLNRDDEKVWEMRKASRVPVISFGFHNEADIRSLEAKVRYQEGRPIGMNFKMSAEGSVVPVYLPGILGEGHVHACLAAAAAARKFGLHLVQIAEKLSAFEVPAGRMRILQGIKQTMLIDDSYNSSPRACRLALRTLKNLEHQEGVEKFAVLGDMKELGKISRDAHREIGTLAARCDLDWLITVGEMAAEIGFAARESGMPEDRIFHFSINHQAGKFVQEKLEFGDIVLLKASRAMHFEEIVKELMADPLEAEKLLVSS